MHAPDRHADADHPDRRRAGAGRGRRIDHRSPTGCDTDPGQRDHGGGRAGPSRPAGRITVFSLVRGPWELRLARRRRARPRGRRRRAAARRRLGGRRRQHRAPWPPATATVTAGRLTSRLTHVPISGDARRTRSPPAIAVHDDAGPLGGPVRVPWLDHVPRPGTWTPRSSNCPRMASGGPAGLRRRPRRRGRRASRCGSTGPTACGPTTASIHQQPGSVPGTSKKGEGMKRSIAAVLGIAMAVSLVLAGCSGGDDVVGLPTARDAHAWPAGAWPPRRSSRPSPTASTRPTPTSRCELKEYDAANYDTQMIADLAAGKAPDIYVQKNLKNFYTYQNGKQLLDVSDVAARPRRQGRRPRPTTRWTARPTRSRTGRTPGCCSTTRRCSTRRASPSRTRSWTWDDYADAPRSSYHGAEGGRFQGARRLPAHLAVDGAGIRARPDPGRRPGERRLLLPQAVLRAGRSTCRSPAPR